MEGITFNYVISIATALKHKQAKLDSMHKFTMTDVATTSSFNTTLSAVSTMPPQQDLTERTSQLLHCFTTDSEHVPPCSASTLLQYLSQCKTLVENGTWNGDNISDLW